MNQQNNNMPARRNPRAEIRDTLVKLEPEFKKALPENVSVEKFTRVAQTAIIANPDLMNCNRTSLWASLNKCAQDGLLPDGREAAMVPYKGVVTYQPMVHGIVKLMHATGAVASIETAIVHQAELDDNRFEHWIDENGSHLRHRPIDFGEKGQPVGAYAVVRMTNGQSYIEIVDRDHLMKIKNKAGQKSPWYGPFELEMWRKTPLKRVAKRMPKTPELARVLEHDNEASALHDDEADGTQQRPAAAPGQSSRLKDLVNDDEPQGHEPQSEAHGPQQQAYEADPPHQDDVPEIEPEVVEDEYANDII